MTQLYTDVSKLAPKLSGDLKINRKKQAVNDLVATLFDTVRMSEWEYVEADNAFKYKINSKLAIFSTVDGVQIRKGIRHFPIGNGKDAERLFNNIRHAKAVIAKAVAEQDKQVKSFMEAFDLDDLDAELSKNDDAVSADSIKVDIKIKDAPPVIAPAEADPVAEEAVKGLGGLFVADDDGVKLEDDPCENDLFADALDSIPQKSSTVDAFLEDEETGPDSPKRSLTAGAVAEQAKRQLQSLQGRVLGIVDAAIADKEQRSAVKTLVNKEFRREMNKL